MASAKLLGCAINAEAKEESGGGDGGSSIAGELSRSRIQPDSEDMSLSVCFPLSNQRGNGDCNPYFRFLESNMDSGSEPMDLEPDPHKCFIDFFDRESYEADTVGEFYIIPNQRLSNSGDSDIWGLDDTEEEIDLGLGIGSGLGSGSGSGQLRGDSGGVGLQIFGDGEIDSGRVEDGTGLAHVGVADEEVDLQKAISWVQEPAHIGHFSLEEVEELSLASGDVDEEDEFEVWLHVNNVGFLEESEDIMVDNGLMDFEYAVYHDEYGENHGDYIAMLDNEAGIMGSPPASKRVVDDLPVVEITSEELSNGNIVCAICKDEIVVDEKVKRLPCRHYYHGECIIPWLGIRNTCPVCRYELLTDDLEYERNRKSQRHGSNGLVRDWIMSG